MRIYNSKGAAALLTVFILLIVFSVGLLGASWLVLNERQISRNVSGGLKSYYVAEAGIEEALLRSQPGHILPSSPSTLNVGGDGTATISIGSIQGGRRAITSEGTVGSRSRRISVNGIVETTKATFFYGAQMGDGGLTMLSGSSVVGNVFSNGSIISSGTITGTAKVAGAGNIIDGGTIGQDAYAYSLEDCDVGGVIHYVTGGSVEDCTAGGGIIEDSEAVQPQDYTISQEMIDDWKEEAEAGGVIVGDVDIRDDTSLGPIKIEGNLFVKGATLTLTGTIWVTGTFDTGTNVTVNLDPASYGGLSGVLIADGNVQVRNNANLTGSGEENSYLLLIGNSTSTQESSPAIDVKNNAATAILFAPNGLMVIHNNVELLEATAYRVLLQNNAEIAYSSGLADLDFTSGPGASWTVGDWQEIP